MLRRERLPDGLLVTDATEGTSADSAGVEQVLITAVDDRRVGATLAGYCRAVAGVESGDARTLTVLTAGGGPRRVEVEFE